MRGGQSVVSRAGDARRYRLERAAAAADHRGTPLRLPPYRRPGAGSGDAVVAAWLSFRLAAQPAGKPDVVVDDRVSVHRAGRVVDGPLAAAAREALMAAVGPARAAIEASGIALRRGSPAVRFQAR